MENTKEKKFYCPICGNELIWESSVDNDEWDKKNNAPSEYYRVTEYYSCSKCGSDVDVYLPMEGEKKQYPFWQNIPLIRKSKVREYSDKPKR